MANLSLFLFDKFKTIIESNKLQVIISINHIAVHNQWISEELWRVKFFIGRDSFYKNFIKNQVCHKIYER